MDCAQEYGFLLEKLYYMLELKNKFLKKIKYVYFKTKTNILKILFFLSNLFIVKEGFKCHFDSRVKSSTSSCDTDIIKTFLI